MKKSYVELFTLVHFLNSNAKDGKTKGQKKIVLISKKVQLFLDDYNEKAEELRLDAASVDKDGNLILNEKGSYSFSKDGLKRLNEKSKELNLSTFDFDPIVINNPEGLEIYPFLDGWVTGVEFKEIEIIEDVEL
jgi:cobalamin biosynthesis Co2+ chelatase CbiK